MTVIAPGYSRGMSLESDIDRQPLPRGTHGLSRETVLESQRVRMYYAVLEAVAEDGYAGTTVAGIISRAKVSRRTFYEHFRDRDGCFAAGFEFAVAYVTERLDAAIAAAPRSSWRTLIRLTLAAYLRVLTDNAPSAQALHVSCVAAGPVVAEYRTRMKTVFADRMRAAFRIGREAGEIPRDIPDEIFDILVGALDDRIREILLTSGAGGLIAQEPLLYQLTVALFGVPDWGLGAELPAPGPPPTRM